jgi:hypothetical protein
LPVPARNFPPAASVHSLGQPISRLRVPTEVPHPFLISLGFISSSRDGKATGEVSDVLHPRHSSYSLMTDGSAQRLANMSAQGISRKRPAPGSVPIGQQPLQPLPQYPTASPQLSDDQFLRWGQNPQANGAASSYPDPSDFNNPTYSSNQTNSMPSNQLTRRPTNQLANRGKPYSDSGGTWVDPNQGPTDPVDGSWTEKDEDLEQKAQLAKRDAMSKRKQIPPFVQKLAR